MTAYLITLAALSRKPIGLPLVYGYVFHIVDRATEDATLAAATWPLSLPIILIIKIVAPVLRPLQALCDWPLYFERRRERKALPEVPKCKARFPPDRPGGPARLGR